MQQLWGLGSRVGRSMLQLCAAAFFRLAGHCIYLLPIQGDSTHLQQPLVERLLQHPSSCIAQFDTALQEERDLFIFVVTEIHLEWTLLWICSKPFTESGVTTLEMENKYDGPEVEQVYLSCMVLTLEWNPFLFFLFFRVGSLGLN